jgi:hypothetical protein
MLPFDTVVPGHGPVTTKAEMVKFRRWQPYSKQLAGEKHSAGLEPTVFSDRGVLPR